MSVRARIDVHVFVPAVCKLICPKISGWFTRWNKQYTGDAGGSSMMRLCVPI